jgi:hypothetical protein
MGAARARSNADSDGNAVCPYEKGIKIIGEPAVAAKRSVRQSGTGEKMEREQGFYWVRPMLVDGGPGAWEVMYWNGTHWFEMGDAQHNQDHDLAVIGPRIAPPDES